MTQEQRAALAARLTEPDMPALTDEHVAAALNASGSGVGTARVRLATSDARGVLLASGEWPVIIMTAEPGSGAPPELRGLCILWRDTLTLTQEIQTDDPARYEAALVALGALQGASLISEATATALIAMCSRATSWAEDHGIGVITSGDVGTIRAEQMGG